MSEVTMRGLCQTLIESYKDFHNLVREPLGLPEFKDKLELLFFPDDSFSLKIWEHLVYMWSEDKIEEKKNLVKGRNK